jgi:CMP-N-acetylneuraminic acid synthetase
MMVSGLMEVERQRFKVIVLLQSSKPILDNERIQNASSYKSLKDSSKDAGPHLTVT